MPQTPIRESRRIAHSLPPPAPAALSARGDELPAGHPTGVRRMPVREDGELAALARVAEAGRNTQAKSTHRAHPSLPPSTQAMLLRLEQNAKRKSSQAPHASEHQAPHASEVQAPHASEVQAPHASELEVPRASELEVPRASELTDSSVRVLPSYSVPPMPAPEASTDGFVPVQADAPEAIEESEFAETWPTETLASPGSRALRYALAFTAFCVALSWTAHEGLMFERASVWSHTTVSALVTTWARRVGVKSAAAPRASSGAESHSTLICDEDANSENVLAMMSSAPEKSATVECILNDGVLALMSDAMADGTAESWGVCQP